MRLPFVSCVVLLVAFSFPARADQPIKISFEKLTKHPERYNGRRVDVVAYIVTSCEHCSEFYASPKVARAPEGWNHGVAISDLARGFKFPKWPRARLDKRGIPNDGYAHIVGTFRYNKPAKDWEERVLGGDEIIHVHVGGFGWSGLRDKAITNITLYDPIGPPIPSGIN